MSIGRYWKREGGERLRERERESENLKVRQFRKSYDLAGSSAANTNLVTDAAGEEKKWVKGAKMGGRTVRYASIPPSLPPSRSMAHFTHSLRWRIHRRTDGRTDGWTHLPFGRWRRRRARQWQSGGSLSSSWKKATRSSRRVGVAILLRSQSVRGKGIDPSFLPSFHVPH